MVTLSYNSGRFWYLMMKTIAEAAKMMVSPIITIFAHT